MMKRQTMMSWTTTFGVSGQVDLGRENLGQRDLEDGGLGWRDLRQEDLELVVDQPLDDYSAAQRFARVFVVTSRTWMVQRAWRLESPAFAVSDAKNWGERFRAGETVWERINCV